MDELKPCPWPECQNKVVRMQEDWKIGYYVWCPVCDAGGPTARSEREAARLWNDREGFDSPKRKDSPIAERGDGDG